MMTQSLVVILQASSQWLRQTPNRGPIMALGRSRSDRDDTLSGRVIPRISRIMRFEKQLLSARFADPHTDFCL